MIEELNKFTNNYKVQVRFSDFDIMRHVNNTRHLVFIEDARINYLENIFGIEMKNMLNIAVLAIVAHIDIDYISPICIGDEVEVFTRCVRIGNKSITLESLTVKKDAKTKKREIATRSSTVLASYDYENATAVENSSEIVNAIINYVLLA